MVCRVHASWYTSLPQAANGSLLMQNEMSQITVYSLHVHIRWWCVSARTPHFTNLSSYLGLKICTLCKYVHPDTPLCFELQMGHSWCKIEESNYCLFFAYSHKMVVRLSKDSTFHKFIIAPRPQNVLSLQSTCILIHLFASSCKWVTLVCIN